MDMTTYRSFLNHNNYRLCVSFGRGHAYMTRAYRDMRRTGRHRSYRLSVQRGSYWWTKAILRTSSCPESLGESWKAPPSSVSVGEGPWRVRGVRGRRGPHDSAP